MGLTLKHMVYRVSEIADSTLRIFNLQTLYCLIGSAYGLVYGLMEFWYGIHRNRAKTELEPPLHDNFVCLIIKHWRHA